MRVIEGLVLKIQGKRVYLRLENIMRMKEESEDAVTIFLRDGTSLYAERVLFDDITLSIGNVYNYEWRRSK